MRGRNASHRPQDAGCRSFRAPRHIHGAYAHVTPESRAALIAADEADWNSSLAARLRSAQSRRPPSLTLCLPHSGAPSHDRSHLGEFRSQLGLQAFEKPSGRPDLNRRPLDPQSHSRCRWVSPSNAGWALEQPKQWLGVADRRPKSAHVGSRNGSPWSDAGPGGSGGRGATSELTCCRRSLGLSA